MKIKMKNEIIAVENKNRYLSSNYIKNTFGLCFMLQLQKFCDLLMLGISTLLQPNIRRKYPMPF